jgi:hypothetical protein
VQPGEIETIGITGLGAIRLNQQSFGFAEQFFAKPELPAGSLQGWQMVAGPLAQIRQQMADRSGLDSAAGLLERLLQRFGQGFVDLPAGPVAQESQVVELGLAEGCALQQRLAVAQQRDPALSCGCFAITATALETQPPDLWEGQGNQGTLAPLEQSLVTVQPQPEGGPLGMVLTVADQGAKFVEAERCRGLLVKQHPGGAKLAPGRKGGSQPCGVKAPGAVQQTESRIGVSIGRTGQPVKPPQGETEDPAAGADMNIGPAAANPLQNSQLRVPTIDQADQIAGPGEPLSGSAAVRRGGQISLRDSQRAAERRCEHV